MDHRNIERRSLAAGQAAWLQVARGGQLVVLRGAVLLSPPQRWLSGCVVAAAQRRTEGERQVFEAGGLALVEALGDAELALVAAPRHAGWRERLAARWPAVAPVFKPNRA
jgi:hypothetical protein